ncbi:histidine kinase [Sporomusaceae bacterium FL31]|nr:histidine kinase [Sporomusaceae bacterium FL31]GCE35211.1 histidine kinase [Sporomusaceae bacterium]
MDSKFHKLIGDEQAFSIEHRLLNIVLVFGLILSIWSAFTNYWLNLDDLLVWTCILSAVLLSILYYLSIVKHLYTFTITMLVLAVLVIVPTAWITNGGISGSIPFYVILFAAMGSAVFFGFQKFVVISYMLIIANVLMYLEYKNPSMIIGYQSTWDRYVDISIGLTTTVIINAVVFMVILKHYNKEHDKAKMYLAQSRQVQEHLQYLSYHDALTGLYNRTYFEREMNVLEQKSAINVGVFAIDIDGLKFINDTFGHNQGDNMLTWAATVFRSTFRESDLIARIGGDEFVVLIGDCCSEDMEALYKSFRANIKQANQENFAAPIPLEMSVGYAYLGKKDRTISELIREADNKMYREKLYRKAGTKGSIIQTLKQLLAARDYQRGTHSDKLQNLIASFSIAAGIPASAITDIQLFAEFHDVGKIGISDAIITKKGILTEDERKEIQRHCEIGYRIAQSSTDLLPIADWILKHHEWWNGEGYPLGLTGQRIPLECRIVAIADAYDAMTNDRPYRSAISHEAAILELQRCAGSQFDPHLVNIFTSIVKPLDN